MTRLTTLPRIALALISPSLFSACRDTTAPASERERTPAVVSAQVNPDVDPSAAITDAADRLTIAVEEPELRAQLQGHLRGLVTAWSEGRNHIASQQLASARRLVKILGDNGLASAADLDAITLALDDAAGRIQTADVP